MGDHVKILFHLVLICFGTLGPRGLAVSFSDVSQRVFSLYCLDCHSVPDPSGGLDLADYQAILDSGVVVPAKPGESLLVEKLESGKMPKGGSPLSSTEIALVRQWILEGAPNTVAPVQIFISSVTPRFGPTSGRFPIRIEGKNLGKTTRAELDGLACTELKIISDQAIECFAPSHASEGPVAVTVFDGTSSFSLANGFTYRLPLGPNYRSLFTNIFKPKCVECHSGSNPPKQLDLSSYGSMLSHRRAIIPFDTKRSRVYKKVREGEMPRGGPPLSEPEVRAIGNWIQNGAKDD